MGTLFRWILDTIVVAIALWVVTLFVPGVRILPPETVIYADGSYDLALVFLGVAAVFIVINEFVAPILHLLGLPITCLTLGLFALVINGGVLLLTGWLSNQLGLGLIIDGFWPAFFGAIVLALARGFLGLFTGSRR
ncbi:phage holin family protein [Corynebacterium alimapuense]|uniref:Phage holin family protein n=1 Tax=Corynebacterium alimapuense TaxID=1576874 RepID=A0A3M8K5T3_9CORY|nr:phage holin family protein [Corynebacterium alimapuense]RNE48229.1 hypothetical protein C5L39_10240 [Corynebacterium alimapuense]